MGDYGIPVLLGRGDIEDPVGDCGIDSNNNVDCLTDPGRYSVRGNSFSSFTDRHSGGCQVAD